MDLFKFSGDNMIPKKILAGGSLSIIAILIIYFNINTDRNSHNNDNNNHENKTGLFASYDDDQGNNPKYENIDINHLLELFKKRYNNNLHTIRSKIRLLGGLIKYYKNIYPKFWKEELIDTIANEFPDYADELIKYIDKTEEYYSYVKDNNELKELSFEEKREKLWQKRKEIFGDDYKDIWSSEIRKKQIAVFVKTLDQHKNLSFKEKLATYKNTVDDLYSSKEDSYKDSEDIIIQQMKLTNKFLNMNSIQEKLGQMAPEARRETLKNLRLQMGLDMDTVKRLEEVDKMRERLWKSGSAYSVIRDYIISKFSGSEQVEKLEEERKKHFGDLADLIKKEEETFKYYRFNRSQKWGVD